MTLSCYAIFIFKTRPNLRLKLKVGSIIGATNREFGEMIMKENMFKQIECLFFDVGTTLADESKAKEHRIWDAIEGADISYDCQ